MGDEFVGTTAIAVTKDDPVIIAKVLSEIAKTHAKFTFEAGVVDGRVIDVADIERLATMPSKEELISETMMSSIRARSVWRVRRTASRGNLTIVLNEAKAKEPQAAAEAPEASE